MAMLRTFIALELEDDLRSSLCVLQDRLRAMLVHRSIRWVRPKGIHLTLKFLGDTPGSGAREIREALARATATVQPFTYTVGSLGCFPNARRPRVIWVAVVEPTGSLARLRDAVEQHVTPLGFPQEKRRFHPHLTLGRVQRYATSQEVRRVGEAVIVGPMPNTAPWHVRELSFIKSDLRPSGAEYTILFKARLGGDQGQDEGGQNG